MRSKKKKLKSSVRIVLVIITLTLISFGVYNFYLYMQKDVDLNFNDKINDDKGEDTYPKEYSINLLATGDGLIHSGIYKAAYKDGVYDFNSIFTEITDIVPNYDIAYINQESPMANKEPSNYPMFNTPQEWGDAMINAGFNTFSLANNHSMDMGESGVLDTVEYFKTKENIIYSGMNSSVDERNNIVTNEIDGISYAFIAYTEQTNGIPVPSGKDYLVNLYSKEKALEDIAKVKDNVDVIIVSMHWGYEYNSEPNDYQKRVAGELADMGVHIILGNHPHWIQPIDYIDDTLVVYSMGNFISNQMTIAHLSPYTDSVTVGAFVMLDINKTVNEDETSNITIDNVTVELIYSYYDTSIGYKVIPFSKMNSDYDSNYVSLYEKHRDRMLLYTDKIKVNPLSS